MSISRSIWNSYKEISLAKSGEACQESLARIRQACFKVEEFLYPQAKRLMAYISLHYQGTIEYLWEDLRNRCHSPPRHPQVVWCLYDH